jgi:citrate lyase subunit beta/citryl-CoA lyase/(S)-citramalyl-CoA lyase
MIDLEDSVHTSEKDKARNALTQLDLRELINKNKTFGVRINNINSMNGIRDLDVVFRCVQSGLLPINYLQIPKVSSHHDVLRCRSYIKELSTSLKIFPIVETPEGVSDLEKIAAASDILLFGQADLTAAMYQTNISYLEHARGRFCVACAQAKICPVDTSMFEEISNMSEFELGCEKSKEEGFMAKAVIHPNQIPIVKKIFSVSAKELEEYKLVIDSYERADTGFQIKAGSVIAPPFVEKAKLMLNFYQMDK